MVKCVSITLSPMQTNKNWTVKPFEFVPFVLFNWLSFIYNKYTYVLMLFTNYSFNLFVDVLQTMRKKHWTFLDIALYFYTSRKPSSPDEATSLNPASFVPFALYNNIVNCVVLTQ